MKNEELKERELGAVVAAAGGQPPPEGGGGIGDAPNMDVDADPV